MWLKKTSDVREISADWVWISDSKKRKLRKLCIPSTSAPVDDNFSWRRVDRQWPVSPRHTAHAQQVLYFCDLFSGDDAETEYINMKCKNRWSHIYVRKCTCSQ